jgi:hypothetical protein
MLSMESHNRCSLRQLIVCLTVPAGLVLMAAWASSPVIAQGTADQRAACEDEARWLCSNYIPDQRAITRCMVRNLNALSLVAGQCLAAAPSDRRRGQNDISEASIVETTL